MLLRPKTSADADGCVALMRQSHETDGYPRYWPGRPARFLTPAQETDGWVLEAQGRIVGHVALHGAAGDPTLAAAQRATALPAERLAVVARLIVSPALRRGGWGRRLLDTAADRAAATGRRPVLDVVRGSVDAIGMYESAGWTRLEPLTLSVDPDLPPLAMWVYLGPCPSGTASAG